MGELELLRENRELRKADEIHWKTRRAHLRELEMLRKRIYRWQRTIGDEGDDYLPHGSPMAKVLSRIYAEMEETLSERRPGKKVG